MIEEMMEAFEVLKKKLTSPPVLGFLDFDALLIVEINAHSGVIDPVYAQKKEERKLNPMQYENRT